MDKSKVKLKKMVNVSSISEQNNRNGDPMSYFSEFDLWSKLKVKEITFNFTYLPLSLDNQHDYVLFI